MKIHALTTGAVRVKHSFLFPSKGVRRQLDLFLPGEFSEPLPIHCWAIEHEERLLLVDSGETAGVRDVPFARFDVKPEQELPAALAAAGLSPGDVSEVVLTHHHTDHALGSGYFVSTSCSDHSGLSLYSDDALQRRGLFADA